jgi:hypothetical protein
MNNPRNARLRDAVARAPATGEPAHENARETRRLAIATAGAAILGAAVVALLLLLAGVFGGGSASSATRSAAVPSSGSTGSQWRASSCRHVLGGGSAPRGRERRARAVHLLATTRTASGAAPPTRRRSSPDPHRRNRIPMNPSGRPDGSAVTAPRDSQVGGGPLRGGLLIALGERPGSHRWAAPEHKPNTTVAEAESRLGGGFAGRAHALRTDLFPDPGGIPC